MISLLLLHARLKPYNQHLFRILARYAPKQLISNIRFQDRSLHAALAPRLLEVGDVEWHG